MVVPSFRERRLCRSLQNQPDQINQTRSDHTNKMSVAELLQQYPQLSLQPNNKIRCSLTKHEMKPNAKEIQQYVQGEKFKKAMEWYTYDYTKFLPEIVPHKSNPHKLYCTITKQELNKIPKEVEKHIQGKRFLRLKQEKEEAEEKKRVKEMKRKEKEEIVKEFDEEPDCWVPDFLDEEEDEEDEGVEVEDSEGDDEEEEDDEEVDEEEEEDEDEEEEEKPTKGQKKRKLATEDSSDSKKTKKAKKAARVIEEDSEDEMVVIRTVKIADKKNKQKDRQNDKQTSATSSKPGKPQKKNNSKKN